MPERSLFDELGGERALSAIVDRFVDRTCDDTMIGFFFRNVDRDRLKRLEYELAASHLGGPVAYTGRPLDKAHARHPIMGGQFMRRLQILKDTLEEFGVPSHVREHWIAHTLGQRYLVTRDEAGQCNAPAVSEPKERT